MWGARNVPLATSLRWEGGAIGVVYDVYLGESITTAVRILSNYTKNTYTLPGKLSPRKTYYWYYYAKIGKLSYRFPSSTKQAYSFSTVKF
jgi:hypothetical protein